MFNSCLCSISACSVFNLLAEYPSSKHNKPIRPTATTLAYFPMMTGLHKQKMLKCKNPVIPLASLRRKGIQNTWGDGCSSWRTSAQQLKWKSSRKAFGVYSPTNRETNQVFSLLRRTSVLGASAQDLRFLTRSIHFLVQFWSNRQYRGRRRIRPNVTSGVLSHCNCKPFNSTCSWNLWSDVRVTSAFSFPFFGWNRRTFSLECVTHGRSGLFTHSYTM